MCWIDNAIVDWALGGKLYFPDGQTRNIGRYHFGFNFDSCVISDDGQYSVIYQKLGTKGLLLKNGEILREINRSYYQADAYEYPVIFLSPKNGKKYLVHCPHEYCRIDFEDVETGEIITNIPERKPSDFFHSRFEVSPDNKFLISKGWGWHPYDFVELFDIDACIKNPLLLDKSNLKPDVDAEICTASFINNHLILIGSPKDSEPFDHEPSEKLKPGQIAIWDIQTNKVSKPVSVDFEFGGHLVAIDEKYAWELFNYPKVINFKSGQVEDKFEDIFSGQQVSSIIRHLDHLPKIAFNRITKQVAISDGKKIEILRK
jgi:hypothetical protein